MQCNNNNNNNNNTQIVAELRKELAESYEALNSLFEQHDRLVFKMSPVVADPAVKDLLAQIDTKSQGALKQCQQLHRLHSQLQSIKAVQSALTGLTHAQALAEIILGKDNEEAPFDNYLAAVEEWKRGQLDVTEELWRSRFTGADKEEMFLAAQEACRDGAVNRLYAQLEKTLLTLWSDSKVNQKAANILESALRPASKSPLFVLFSGYPVETISRLLSLSPARPLLSRFPDILFARLYAIINDGFSSVPAEDEAFAAASLESLGPEHLRYATRLSAVIEAYHLIVLLHSPSSFPVGEALIESESGAALIDQFTHKTTQIIRQIRKTAERKRNYPAATRLPPAHLNGLLNEIALIEEILSGCVALPLERERAAWRQWSCRLESAYLAVAIETALSQDRVSTAGPFPVSTCIDEVFYVLKAALGRRNGHLVDGQLRVLMERISEGLEQQQQHRSMVQFLILLNNAIQCRAHYTVLMGGERGENGKDSSGNSNDSSGMHKDPSDKSNDPQPQPQSQPQPQPTPQPLPLLAVIDGVIKRGIERLYALIRTQPLPNAPADLISSLALPLPSAVSQALAPVGIEELILHHASHVSPALLTALLEPQQSQPQQQQSLFLRLQQQQRALHSLGPRFEARLERILQRPLQAISLLEAGLDEFEAVLEDLKAAGELQLRAGEILQLRELIEQR